MAHGTCGDQFRAAFSCFVYSKDEPKGMDCIDKFKKMQGCFREHPEEYGAELEDEEEDGEGEELYDDASGTGQIGLERHGETDVGGTTTAAIAAADGQTRYPSGEPLPEAAKKGVRDAEDMTVASEMGRPLPPPPATAAAAATTTNTTSSSSPSSHSSDQPTAGSRGGGGRQQRQEESTQRAKAAKSKLQTQRSGEEQPTSKSDSLVPKAAHDARVGDAQGEK